ncbi:MAG: enoyl-CoA hydratase/isomerase family protein [Actinomycetes bacterium]
MSERVVELSWQGPDGIVAVITMNDGENRFDLDVVRHWHELIDEVAAKEGPLALVTTGTGKFYSNGLNLDWLLSTPDQSREFLHELNRLWGRILGLDCHTTAAVNGHCFGAGALLTSAHDRITMRADRGYWCMPELDLALPVSEKMAGLLLARLPRTAIARALNTAHRFTGPDALAAGIADEILSEDELLAATIAHSAMLATKSRDVIGVHKQMLFGGTISALTSDLRNDSH